MFWICQESNPASSSPRPSHHTEWNIQHGQNAYIETVNADDMYNKYCGYRRCLEMSCAATAWWAITTLLYHTVHTPPSAEKETAHSDLAHFSSYTVSMKGILLCAILYTWLNCCAQYWTDTGVKSWVNDNLIPLSSYMPDDSFMTTGKSSSVLNIHGI